GAGHGRAVLPGITARHGAGGHPPAGHGRGTDLHRHRVIAPVRGQRVECLHHHDLGDGGAGVTHHRSPHPTGGCRLRTGGVRVPRGHRTQRAAGRGDRDGGPAGGGEFPTHGTGPRSVPGGDRPAAVGPGPGGAVRVHLVGGGHRRHRHAL